MSCSGFFGVWKIDKFTGLGFSVVSVSQLRRCRQSQERNLMPNTEAPHESKHTYHQQLPRPSKTIPDCALLYSLVIVFIPLVRALSLRLPNSVFRDSVLAGSATTPSVGVRITWTIRRLSEHVPRNSQNS